MSMSGIAQCSQCSQKFFCTEKSTFLVLNGHFICPNCIPTPTTSTSTNGLIDLTKSHKNEIMVKMRSNQILTISNDTNLNVTNLACNPDGIVSVHTSTNTNTNPNVNLVQNSVVGNGIFIGNGNAAVGSFGDGNFGKIFFNNCGEIDLSNSDQTEMFIKQRYNQVLKVINNSNQSVTTLTPNGEVTITSNILNTIGSAGVPVFSTPLQNIPSYFFVSSTDPSEYPSGSSLTRNNSTFRASNCTIAGCNNSIEGNGNQLSGNSNLLLGSNNKVKGHNNEARGNWNEFVGGNNNKAVGLGNKFTGCTFNKM